MTAYSTKNIDISSKQIASVALRTFFNIMREWNISEAEQITILGTPPFETFKNWQEDVVLSLNTNTLKRISYIIVIYKNLRLLFPTSKQANDWVHKPNKYFKGDSAIALISSEHLSEVHKVAEYLNNLIK